MHNLYRGRSHTKKQPNNCKPKIPAEVKLKRKKARELLELFPRLEFKLCLPAYKDSCHRRLA
jgi:hypothetical protein